jgi:hypothetical protein
MLGTSYDKPWSAALRWQANEQWPVTEPLP